MLLRSLLALLVFLSLVPLHGEDYDVVVYGGVPCGIAASIAAARV